MSYMHMGVIYLTRCITTGRIYVGLHVHKTVSGKGYLGSGVLLQKAIRKYGRRNFESAVLTGFNSLEEGFSLEKEWIKKLNSKVPNGYNLTDGGEGVVNPCQEVRDKISRANSHPLSEEHRAHLSLSHRGLSSPRKGKPGTPLSKEHKIKLLLSNLGRTCTKVTRKKMSLAKMGHPVDEKCRTKLSIAMRGKPWSPARHRAQELRKENYNFVPSY